MLNKIPLYYHTLKYLQPVQIYGRIFSAFKKRFNLVNLPEVDSINKTGISAKTRFLFHDPWNSKEMLLDGRFTFLSEEEKLGFPPKWKRTSHSLLWNYNLHYFHYLNHLDEGDKIKICLDWIDKNLVGEGKGWYPYPLSQRIVNWCKNDLENNLVNISIYQQAAYLFRNLEYYHPANHYLENARALIFAGLYFKGIGESGKWLKKGADILADQLKFQILKDGGYFERTTMYHALMLELVLDVINIFPEENYYLKETAEKMLNFLIDMTHPDGHITLFNDSTTEVAPSTSSLIDYASRLGIVKGNQSNVIKRYYDTGYYLINNEDLYFIIDGGKIGPDNIPAHAHADIFSYELSYKGEQFIVDTGVLEYAEGELRSYCRSTKAHNTVTIDDRDQVEIWGSFRVGRRKYPYDIEFKKSNNRIYFTGRYNGIEKFFTSKIIHNRKITYSEESKRIEINDSISGEGTFSVKSYIHLHPDVKIISDDDKLTLIKNEVIINILILEGEYKIINSSYFPKFGIEKNNKVIIISQRILPTVLKYILELQ